MSMNQARFGLMGIFVGSLVVQLVALLLIRSKLWPEDFQALMVKMLGIYSIQLGVVWGGHFCTAQSAAGQSSDGTLAYGGGTGGGVESASGVAIPGLLFRRAGLGWCAHQISRFRHGFQFFSCGRCGGILFWKGS